MKLNEQIREHRKKVGLTQEQVALLPDKRTVDKQMLQINVLMKQERYEEAAAFCDLWNALNTLPETQGLRIDACIIEGKSMTEVAEADGVSVAAVHKSIQQGLKSMKKYLQNV